MANYSELPPQFILWQYVDKNDGKKPAKIPCCQSRQSINHLDPNEFMDYQTASEHAARLGVQVGFVLTKDDPYFVLDLDGVKDPATGGWNQHAQNMSAMFPNAPCEISVSGNGLHFWGMCDKVALGDRRKRFKHNGEEIEVYTHERFIALGSPFQEGTTLALNWTDVLSQLLPVINQMPTMGDSATMAGPVGEYTGPQDDEKLITMMLNSGGSTAQQFGDKATFRQLWECDEDALSNFWPSTTGDTFDRSRADGALMLHLAFWTGKDKARMERLMRRSGLVRPKWDKHRAYLGTTCTEAYNACQKVYDNPPKNTMTQEEKAEKQEQKNQVAMSLGELLGINDQLEYFKGCVYVISDKRILMPNGSYLDQQQFKAVMGGHAFMINSAGTKPTDNAFEAFTENKLHKFPKVNFTEFLPSQPYQYITQREGLNYVNIFMKRNPPALQGDTGPFDNLLGMLLPDDNDRAILLSYMAACVQHQGVKFKWAPILIGTHGTGKSTMIDILQYCIDGVRIDGTGAYPKNTFTMTANDIGARFNGMMLNKSFCGVHEMHTQIYTNQRETEDYLKSLLTETQLTIEKKNVDQVITQNVINFMFCSNHSDAVRIESTERRFAVFHTIMTAEEKAARGATPEFFAEFWDWLRNGGYEIVHYHLINYQIPYQFDPKHGAQNAPISTTHHEAVLESKTDTERLILESIEMNEQGFRNGFVSLPRLLEFAIGENKKIGTGKAIGKVLKDMGYIHKRRMSCLEETEKLGMYYSRNKIEPSKFYDEYLVAQGYMTPAIGIPVQNKMPL